MDSLVQRVKDLNPVTFQHLCFQIMSERFPLARVRYPEGAAGDEGIDLFEGDLTQGSTVWQCKSFAVTVLGDSQKQQIRESLRIAVKNVQPRLWILCLNLNMNVKAVRWFQRLQQSYAAKGVEVADPFGSMELSRELMFRRTIRDNFFPNMTLDVQGLKSLLKSASSKMSAIEDEELEKLATENTEEYLDRLQRRDPRFTYEVTFGGDRGPSVFPPRLESGLMSSMTDGRKTYKAFVRDHEALRLDPVGSNFQVNESGRKKFIDLLKTGREQTWTPDEIRAFRSTVPFLSEMKFAPGALSLSVQSMPDSVVIPVRMMFSSGNRQAVIDYVEFRKTRSGSEEVEITSVGIHPLGMTLVLPFDLTSEITATITTNLPGQNIRDVSKACAVFMLLQHGCTLELTSLKVNGHLCTLTVNPLPLPFKPPFFKFVDDLSAIAKKFNVDLQMPATLKMTGEEEKTFMMLRAFALNEPQEIDRFTTTLVKSLENAVIVPQEFREEIRVRLDHENASAKLFGTSIKLGATSIVIDRAEVVQFAVTLKRFVSSKIGATVPFELRPLVPVRFELRDTATLLTS